MMIFKKVKETTILLFLLVSSVGLITLGFWWAYDWFWVKTITRNLCMVPQEDQELPTAQTSSSAKESTFSGRSGLPSGLFNYGGSLTWLTIHDKMEPIIQANWPQFRLRYVQPINQVSSAETGIKMLITGQLSFAYSSRPLRAEEYRQAESRGFSLVQIPVAIDSLVIWVHRGLSVSELSLSQIKDIYTGVIDNWAQVGGPSLAITPYANAEAAEFLVSNILAEEELGNTVEIVSEPMNSFKKLNSRRGAIYYASAAEGAGACQMKALSITNRANRLISVYEEPHISTEQCQSHHYRLNTEVIKSGAYPMTRRLFIIFRRDSSIDEQAGAAYANLLLNAQSQNFMRYTGFSSIHERAVNLAN